MRRTESWRIDRLNTFLQGEMSAVATYEQALGLLDDEPSLKKLLTGCLASHRLRTQWLRSEVLALGGEPAQHLSSSGALAKMLERGAVLLGMKAALKTLEEGEARGLNDYEREAPALPQELRDFVQSKLLPEQRHTHATLTQLTSLL